MIVGVHERLRDTSCEQSDEERERERERERECVCVCVLSSKTDALMACLRVGDMCAHEREFELHVPKG